MTLPISMEVYSEQIGLLYDGVEDSAHWQTFLHNFCRAVSSRDASLMVINSGLETMSYLLHSEADPKFSEEEIERSLKSSTFIHEIPCPVPTTISEMMSEERFLNSNLYKEYFYKSNVRHLLSQDITRSENYIVRLTLKRTASQGPFGQEEKQLLSLIVPHFRRALVLRDHHYKNQFRKNLSEETINRLQVGYILLDRKGRISSLNDTALEILKARKGLISSQGYLKLADDAHAPEFFAMLNKLLAGDVASLPHEGPLGCRIDSRLGKPLLNVVLRPIADMQQLAHGPVVLVYLCDFAPDSISVEADVMREVFGLTKSEAKLAVRLAMGESVTEAAEQLHVSINTVRTHLRGIYQKLNTNKQYELVALLNRSVARFI